MPKKQNTNQNRLTMFLRILVGLIFLVFGAIFCIGTIIEVFNGEYILKNSSVYEPITRSIVHYSKPLIGIVAIVLGAQLILNKAKNRIIWALFILLFGVNIATSWYLSPQVYLSNWDKVTELVNTAAEEYPAIMAEDDFEPMDHTIYGEKTYAKSIELQRAIDSQSDENIIKSLFIGSITAAACCFTVLYRRETKK